MFILTLFHISASQIYGFYLYSKTKMIPNAKSNIVAPILTAQKKSVLRAAFLLFIVYAILYAFAFQLGYVMDLGINPLTGRVAPTSTFYALFCSYIVFSLVLTARKTFLILAERLEAPHKENIRKWTAVYIAFSVSGIIVFPLILAGIALFLQSRS
ncbi:MAG: hypothetical protein PHX68_02415 [Alphaproteobacteria bacterium]|nr:hypothetical protein [Alphaproteobacteria bacterium]